MIELLLTIVFVMLGSQFIQGSLLSSALMFGRYSNTLTAMLWADEQLSRSREALLRDEPRPDASGTLETPRKAFSWTQQSMLADSRNLHTLQVSISWTENGRPQNYNKEIYVYKKDAIQGF